MKTAPRLVLRLLGGFALERDGASCKIAYEKGRGLLAYLAVESGRDHMRTSLAAMLWPDLARDAALSNLRLVLHNLRQALDVPAPHASPLHIDREHVRLDPTPDLRIDIADFSAPDPKCPSLPCRRGLHSLPWPNGGSRRAVSRRVHGGILTAGLPGVRGVAPDSA
jgi:hypothetical protein